MSDILYHFIEMRIHRGKKFTFLGIDIELIDYGKVKFGMI